MVQLCVHLALYSFLDEVLLSELCEGNLKSTLSLFFSLSRFAQLQKKQQQTTPVTSPGQQQQQPSLKGNTHSSPQLSALSTDVNANATHSNPDMLSR